MDGNRVATIDKIVTKLYTDNAAGKLDDDRLNRMVGGLERGVPFGRWGEIAERVTRLVNHRNGVKETD